MLRRESVPVACTAAAGTACFSHARRLELYVRGSARQIGHGGAATPRLAYLKAKLHKRHAGVSKPFTQQRNVVLPCTRWSIFWPVSWLLRNRSPAGEAGSNQQTASTNRTPLCRCSSEYKPRFCLGSLNHCIINAQVVWAW